MKIQVDLDGELWAKFRAKVHHEGKTLGSVVPTIFEPALRAYVEPPVLQSPLLTVDQSQMQSLGSSPSPPIVDRLPTPHPTVPPPTVKRCELCDQVVDRLFASAGKRVCYVCWRAELTAGQ